MRYGYKVSVAYLTPRYRPEDRVALDDPALGDQGALGLVTRVLNEAMKGEADERRSVYTRFDRVTSSGWGVLLAASGGSFGEPAEVVDRRTGDPRASLGTDDALLRDARLLFVLPPYGTQGLMISEARGRSHLGPAVVTRLNKRLASAGLVLRLDTAVADDVAWNAYLEREDVSVSGVELVQHRRSADGGRFTEEDVIKKARLSLDLAPDTRTQQRVRGALGQLRGKRAGRVQLAGLVGLRQYGDDDFDEERLFVVQDGRRRNLNVTHGWPAFAYDLGEDRLSEAEFLAAVHDAAADTLAALEVDRSPTWWPVVGGVSPAA